MWWRNFQIIIGSFLLFCVVESFSSEAQAQPFAGIKSYGFKTYDFCKSALGSLGGIAKATPKFLRDIIPGRSQPMILSEQAAREYARNKRGGYIILGLFVFVRVGFGHLRDSHHFINWWTFHQSNLTQGLSVMGNLGYVASLMHLAKYIARYPNLSRLGFMSVGLIGNLLMEWPTGAQRFWDWPDVMMGTAAVLLFSGIEARLHESAIKDLKIKSDTDPQDASLNPHTPNGF